MLAARRGTADTGDAAVGAARLVAALAYGAVVFQAAQSLQVPAWSSHLLGVWAAGALLHAYATGAVGPLLVGLAAGTSWYVWAVTEQTTSSSGVALALLLSAGAATAVAVLHGARGPVAFAGPWRAAAALLALGGLFGAALPASGEDLTPVPAVVWGGAAVVLLALAAAAAVTAERTGRLELAARARRRRGRAGAHRAGRQCQRGGRRAAWLTRVAVRVDVTRATAPAGPACARLDR